MNQKKWNNYNTFVEPTVPVERNKRQVEIIQTLIGDIIKDSSKILDLGTGDGLIREQLAKINKKPIIGLDREIRTAKNKKHLIKSDITNLPFKDKSLDLIIFNGAYQYIKNKDIAITEISRVLKKGGHLFLAAPLKYALLEGNYMLYFLSWLPRTIANIYVNIFRNTPKYRVYQETYSKMNSRLSRSFSVTDISLKALNQTSTKNIILSNTPHWIYTLLIRPFNPNIKLLCKKTAS